MERVPLAITPNPENIAYLRTKRDKLGHLIDLGDDDRVGALPVPPDDRNGFGSNRSRN